MEKGVMYGGIPSREELAGCPGRPSKGRINEGRVAFIECFQNIPCNPCEKSCPLGAIQIGKDITNLPRLNEKKCAGCGACIASCPGQAITVINAVYAEGLATVEFPYEFYPLPEKGQKVTAVDRAGQPVCEATVLSVKNPKNYDNTNVICISIPAEYYDDVRSIKRLGVRMQWEQ